MYSYIVHWAAVLKSVNDECFPSLMNLSLSVSQARCVRADLMV